MGSKGRNAMKAWVMITAGVVMLSQTPAFAISEAYRQKLEHSGCTQVSELQGCDINKSKAENAKAGFVTAEAAAPTTQATADPAHPYTGQWAAKNDRGDTVATIRVDKQEHVWVNGEKVKAKRSDGALEFHQGSLVYRIQGDRRLKDEDKWMDRDAGTSGPIVAE